MNVLLKPQLAKFIDEQVQQGRFDSAEDAINAAVARLQTERDLAGVQLDRLREELDVGIAEADRGEFVEFSAEDVIAERHAARATKEKRGRMKRP
jgi:antitoxin ParD1/3/4